MTYWSYFLYLAIDCGNLEPPLNGKINLSGTTFESIAMYSCNNGFFLDGGDQTRVCQISGEWSGEASTCTGKYLPSWCRTDN